MRIKASEALRFLLALGVVLLVLAFVALRVTGCAPEAPRPGPPPLVAVPPVAPSAGPEPAPEPLPPPPSAALSCDTPGFGAAARANAASLRTLAWAPFGRPETGWEVYAPLIAREIGTACAPDTAGFAQALASWQGRQRTPADGVLSADAFARLKGVVQARRPFVQLSARKVCPDPPADSTLEAGRPGEGYGGKQVLLRPAAFAAWRRMVAAARAEVPAIVADPRYLTIFSAYRSPDYDAARCARDGDCDGIARAACSPHRTGLALDLYVGEAPGFGPDSSADANRLFMSRTPAYRWLLANANRFGFVNYPFEPWHWEWIGEAP